MPFSDVCAGFFSSSGVEGVIGDRLLDLGDDVFQRRSFDLLL